MRIEIRGRNVEVSDELSWDYDDDIETASGYYRSHPFTSS